jgi:hypothetical protein
MNTKKIIAAVGIAITIIIVFVAYNISKTWMLSLYGNGQTIMRLDYHSKESCLSAGRSYIADKSAERFDCGYKCSSFDKSNLSSSPICKTVCNEVGCR